MVSSLQTGSGVISHRCSSLVPLGESRAPARVRKMMALPLSGEIPSLTGIPD